MNAKKVFLPNIERELNLFLYSVAHNLRKPLFSIDECSEYIKTQYEKKMDLTGKKYLQRLSSEIKKMNQMFDEIEQLCRISTTKLKKEVVDLSGLITRLSEKLLKENPARNIKFRITSGIKASGDSRLLEIAFKILLDNALKFSIKKKSAIIEFGVQLAFHWNNTQKVYYISDTGIGYDKKIADRILGIFQKMHDEREYPGLGSGLATVQRIIHMHQGRIHPDTTLNEGAVFYFTLGNN